MKAVFQSEILECPRRPAEVDEWYRHLSKERRFLDVTEDRDLLRFHRSPDCVGYRFFLQNPFTCLPGRSEHIYIANFGVCFALPVLAFDLLPQGDDTPFQKILYQLLGSTPEFTKILTGLHRKHLRGFQRNLGEAGTLEAAVGKKFAELSPEVFDCSNDANLGDRLHLWRWMTSPCSYLWFLDKRPPSWIKKQSDYYDELAYSREICFLYFLQIYGTFLGQIIYTAKGFLFTASDALDADDPVWRRCGARLHTVLGIPWEYRPGEERIRLLDHAEEEEEGGPAGETEQGPSKRFGRYEVVRKLGEGGMSEVYLGVDPAIGREVVIKSILSIELDSEKEKEWWNRFRDEAKLAGGLSHPNVVRIFDMGVEGRIPYIVMQYLDGESLRDLIDSGRSFTMEEKVHIICQIGSALECAHGKGIVHRDIKPANIMVLPGNMAVLTDFGIAAIHGHVEGGAGAPSGSLPYMPPEAFAGRVPDASGDQFALAVTAFEFFYGVHPFRGTSDVYTIRRITSEEPAFASVANPDLLPGLERILRRGLHKYPSERYARVSELAESLRNALAEAVLISQMKIINLDDRYSPVGG
jgi:tRNA A-37 threonylcarbamoyl transferase component Bud32